ncbi:hypothetical protein [Tepidimicrobium xylanilyticum]
MEDILREILYELKEIRKEIKKNNATIEVKMNDDVITEKVIKNINAKNRIQGDRMINI